MSWLSADSASLFGSELVAALARSQGETIHRECETCLLGNLPAEPLRSLRRLLNTNDCHHCQIHGGRSVGCDTRCRHDILPHLDQSLGNSVAAVASDHPVSVEVH